MQTVIDSGRAMVLAFNKWDTLDEDRRYMLEREIERDLAHVQWAPRVNISAKTGWHKDKLVPALEHSLESWDSRIPTGRLNAFLGEIVARIRTRCVAVSSRVFSSALRCLRVRRSSCSLLPVSWIRVTAASLCVVCVRPLISRVLRLRFRCVCVSAAPG